MVERREYGIGGSSPRLRGTSVAASAGYHDTRFIPAPAGNIFIFWFWFSDLSVHPRACGEHTLYRRRLLKTIGSSPRLRGTFSCSFRDWKIKRFIPAPAGNICRLESQLKHHPVHPRACGEHPRRVYFVYGDSGSSPRLRGTFRHRSHPPGPIRFIPAPAGNIPRAPPKKRLTSVHPRACGEHKTGILHPPGEIGSSPRLRGTCSHGVVMVRFFRFIPAPAGNIGAVPICQPTPSVHPRACGEHPLPSCEVI